LELLLEESEDKIGSYPPLLRYIMEIYGGVIPRMGGPFPRSNICYSIAQGTP